MYMTVGRLKAMLADTPDETLIVRPASDHSYELASVGFADAEKTRGGFVEYHGPDYMENHGNPVTRVLVMT